MAQRYLSHVVLGLAATASVGGLVALASAQPVRQSAVATPSGSLASFKSDDDLRRFAQRRREHRDPEDTSAIHDDLAGRSFSRPGMQDGNSFGK